ncbi:MAG: NUDIX hydrolase [Clostridia bacterium]|nr:NUDIX hydrolase [Clostridia bacterium]
MDEKDLIEKEIKANTVYSGHIVNLRNDDVLLPNGVKSKREYVEHPGGATILAFDNEGNILLERQFRYPYREVIWEIPAGKLEKGEDPMEAAKRELEEETGMVAGKIEKLGLIYPSPGYTNEHLYIYLATDLKPTRQHLDENEFLSIVKMPFEKAVDMVMNGEIKDSKTCYAILKYAIMKK